MNKCESANVRKCESEGRRDRLTGCELVSAKADFAQSQRRFLALLVRMREMAAEAAGWRLTGCGLESAKADFA